MSIIDDFKEFIAKGNVMDLTIGVIIGNSFSDFTKSFVNNIVSPPVNMLINAINSIKQEAISSSDKALNNVDISGIINTKNPLIAGYGSFLQSSFNFLIMAGTVFFMVKLVNKLKNSFSTNVINKTTPTEITNIVEKIDNLDIVKESNISTNEEASDNIILANYKQEMLLTEIRDALRELARK